MGPIAGAGSSSVEINASADFASQGKLPMGVQADISKFRVPKVPRRTEMRALDREIQMKKMLIQSITTNQ